MCKLEPELCIFLLVGSVITLNTDCSISYGSYPALCTAFNKLWKIADISDLDISFHHLTFGYGLACPLYMILS